MKWKPGAVDPVNSSKEGSLLLKRLGTSGLLRGFGVTVELSSYLHSRVKCLW